MEPLVNPLIAELNKDIGEVFVEQANNKAFRAPNFRQFTRIHNSRGKITKKLKLKFFHFCSSFILKSYEDLNNAGTYHPACCVVRANFHQNGLRYEVPSVF